MNFDDAIAKHCDWKIRFRTSMLLKEQMNVASISSDCNCELGKWLHSEGEIIYGYLDSFQHCVSVHAAFHREAGIIAELINQAKYAEASALMDTFTNFDNASHAVGVAIIKLRNEASSS